jgi:hypothetical protein
LAFGKVKFNLGSILTVFLDLFPFLFTPGSHSSRYGLLQKISSRGIGGGFFCLSVAYWMACCFSFSC